VFGERVPIDAHDYKLRVIPMISVNSGTGSGLLIVIAPDPLQQFLEPGLRYHLYTIRSWIKLSGSSLHTTVMTDSAAHRASLDLTHVICASNEVHIPLHSPAYRSR
jgi:hypothetical protein